MNGWHHVYEDINNYRLNFIYTVGFVEYEDDEKIVISHSYNVNEVMCDSFIVPKCCIVEMADLSAATINGKKE